jgi:secondary thiamine-phosphate synthase enzyme
MNPDAKIFPDESNELYALRVFSERLHLKTAEHLEFVDLTEWLERCLARAGIRHGLANVQTRHTTAALVVNENEPLLLVDLQEQLARLVPRHGAYRHDRFDIRTVNMSPGERANGHSHARAMLLPTSTCLNVVEGRLDLGCYQRLFFVELDGPRERSVSALTLGSVGGNA